MSPHGQPVLSTGANFTVAIATVHRSIAARLKGYFSVFATLSACCRKHSAWRPVAIAAISGAFRFPCLATFGTALGLISVTLGLEELLLVSAEGEGSATIGTLERFVLKAHRMTSFFFNIWLEYRSSNV